MKGMVVFCSFLVMITLMGSGECREGSGPLVLTARLDKEAYRASEPISVSVEVKNMTGKALWLVKAQDGSERKIRYPYCLFEVKNAGGQEMKMRSPVDKTVAPLEPEAFFEIKPGATEKLFEKPYPLSGHMILGPGSYSLVVRYSTEAQKESQWYGLYSDDYWDGERRGNEFWKKREGAMKRNRDLLAKVPSLTVASKEVRFTVTAPKTTSREEALAIAEGVCREKGWKWVKPHANDNQLWWDVTTGFGSLGNNAFIRIEKSTGKVLDHHMTGP
ncbi:MAG: hypothetical protein RDV48_18790 [Candidatus Eremiobacteraeota bacterium]|nr:hypothetical protein [Candidatus Eremiobacteraeota bacterium]